MFDWNGREGRCDGVLVFAKICFFSENCERPNVLDALALSTTTHYSPVAAAEVSDDCLLVVPAFCFSFVDNDDDDNRSTFVLDVRGGGGQLLSMALIVVACVSVCVCVIGMKY